MHGDTVCKSASKFTGLTSINYRCARTDREGARMPSGGAQLHISRPACCTLALLLCLHSPKPCLLPALQVSNVVTWLVDRSPHDSTHVRLRSIVALSAALVHTYKGTRAISRAAGCNESSPRGNIGQGITNRCKNYRPRPLIHLSIDQCMA